MAKYNIKRRHSKTLDLSTGIRYRPLSRRLDFGGVLDYNGKERGLGWNKASGDALKSSFSDVGNAVSSVGSVVGGVTSIIDSARKNAEIADTSGIRNEISETGNTDYSGSLSYDDLLGDWGGFTDLKNDYTMKDVRGVSGLEMAGNTLSAIGSGAMAGASVGGPWGAVAGAAVGLGGAIAGIFSGNNKARKEAEALNELANEAMTSQNQNFAKQAERISKNSYNDMMANITADGGLLSFNDYDIVNYAKDGGKIHIKPSKRGTFTAAAKKHGKSVQAFAAQVLANKENYSPAMVKKANFARNFGGRKKANGGHLIGGTQHTHGGEFSNGVVEINAGGTHSENPYEGVQMGVDPQGIPNLVEEGEVIFNDYVFSNRLHPSEKELEKANLPKRYKGHTFAFIAEDMSKESSERPNDPISQRGLRDSLGKLALLQEQQRMKKGKKGTQQMMALGGRKYSGLVPLEDDPYEGSKEQALEEAELEWLVKQDPQLWEELQAIGSTPDKSLPTYLRYAPALGSALGALTSVIQKPDYSNSDLILGIANNLSKDKVRYRPISNYLTYRPLDRNYYLNQLKGQAGATRRGIINSGSNAGSVIAGLLAADYNAQNAVGDTLMKMDMYNEQQRQAVEQFNRGTNQYNSLAAMNADAQNAQIAQNRDKLRSSLMTQAAQMREAVDTALEATRSANLTNFFDNMGGIGQDNMAQNWRNRLIDVGYFGAGSDRIVGKNGGRLLTKKNRRRK